MKAKIERFVRELKLMHERKYENLLKQPWHRSFSSVISEELLWADPSDIDSFDFLNISQTRLSTLNVSISNHNSSSQQESLDSWWNVEEENSHRTKDRTSPTPSVSAYAAARQPIVVQSDWWEGDEGETSSPPEVVPNRSGPVVVLETQTDEVQGSLRVETSSATVNDQAQSASNLDRQIEQEHDVADDSPVEPEPVAPGHLKVTMERVELRKDSHSSVINLSGKDLDEDTLGILSRGLSFAPVPPEINKLQMETDLRSFERRLRLAHHFADEDPMEEDPERRFRKKSTWTPYANQDRFLDVYIAKVIHEIKTAQPQKYKNNLTKQERKALMELKKRKDIIIKEADKGSAVVVMDKDRYINESKRQLGDENVYKQLNEDSRDEDYTDLQDLVERMLAAGILTEDQSSYILPDKFDPGRMYLLPKVHKLGVPGRPVISGCGSLTENLSDVVDHLIKHLIPSIPSYLRDTFDFLEKIRSIDSLPGDALLVTVDVVALYPSIPHDDGIKCLASFLRSHGVSDATAESICEMAEFVLKRNVFEFQSDLFLQTSGTAIGTKMAPSYANIFMAELEDKFLQSAPFKPRDYWRFIDDIYFTWTHGLPKLREFLDFLNFQHPCIKFTADFGKCINFLDVRTEINQEGLITTDIYYKATDSHQYLDPSSCHPNHIKENLPYSQSLRIASCCSEDDRKRERGQEMIGFFTARGYDESQVKQQVDRALEGGPRPRRGGIRWRKPRTGGDTERSRIPLVLTFHPGLPDIKAILHKNQDILHMSEKMRKAVPELPLLSFRQPPNLKKMLVRAKVDDKPKDTGCVKPCGIKNCKLCPMVDQRKRVSVARSQKKERHQVLANGTTCSSEYVVYCILCSKCSFKYVGMTTNSLKKRITGHCAKLKKFIQDGESDSDFDQDTTRLYQHLAEHNPEPRSFKVLILEKIEINGSVADKRHQLMEERLRRRETEWIWKLNTIWPSGLNVNDGFYCQTKKRRK